MKRSIILSFIGVIIIAWLFPIWSYAHSGDTDSRGGHYDHSTGGYHYHHGYPAHQHEDLDGDGDIDCPYNFNGKYNGGYSSYDQYSQYTGKWISTANLNEALEEEYQVGYKEGHDAGYQEGENSGYEDGYNTATAKLEEEYAAKLENEVAEAKSSAYLFSIFIGAPVLIYITSLFCQKGFNKQERVFREEISNLKKEVVKAKNYATLSGSYLNTDAVSEIPEGVILLPLVLPVSGRTNEGQPYGDYTIYTSPRGSKYHCRYGCGRATHPTHFYLRNSEMEPCKNCVPTNMYPGKLPDWYINVTRYKPPTYEGTARTDHTPKKETNKPHTETANSVGPAPNTGIKEMSFNMNSLIVTFGNGKVFKYIDIPEEKGNALINSSNPVQFFKSNIDGYYIYQLVKE